VVEWMSRAEGAPKGEIGAYMRGIAARVAERTNRSRVDDSSPLAFLLSLRDAGLLRLEDRPEASSKREDPSEFLDQGILTFADEVDPEDLDV
jgi:hypothetical protein